VQQELSPSYGAGFRSLTAEIAEPIALAVTGKLRPGSPARFFAPVPPNSRWDLAPSITGSTDWRCCIAFPSPMVASPMPTVFSRAKRSPPPRRPARSATANLRPIPAALYSAASPRSSAPSSPTALCRQAVPLCLGHWDRGQGRFPRFNRQDRHQDRNGRDLVRGGSLPW
jgi:hypothetical protein